MKDIAIIGAGGCAREVYNIIERINKKDKTYNLVGFVVEEGYIGNANKVYDIPVVENLQWLIKNKNHICAVCAIGIPKTRRRIQKMLMCEGIQFETVVDPSTIIHETSRVGVGCVIYGDIRISVDCKIGDGVLINGGTGIGHDVVVGDYTVISPRTSIGGNCFVGECVNIGGHAYITPKKKVGSGATVAAGSIVFSNVKDNTTVLGNPAKRMREIED